MNSGTYGRAASSRNTAAGSSIAAPPQERVIIVPGGADYAAGILTLDAGTIFPLAVRAPDTTGVPAYVRFTSRATPDAVVEAFSNSSGVLNVRLIPGRYDVLLALPDPAPTLRDRREYAIRVANAGTWDAACGWTGRPGCPTRC